MLKCFFSNTGDTWDDYFRDNELLTQIDKDARRLYPDLGFFSQATVHPANETIDPEYKLGMLKDRVNKSNLAALSSKKGRNGVKMMTSNKNQNDEEETLSPNEEANWEGKNFLISKFETCEVFF